MNNHNTIGGNFYNSLFKYQWLEDWYINNGLKSSTFSVFKTLLFQTIRFSWSFENFNIYFTYSKFTLLTHQKFRTTMWVLNT